MTPAGATRQTPGKETAMTLRFFPSLAVLGLAGLAASSSAALTGVRNGQRTFSPGQQVPIVCDQNDAVTNEIELSGATMSGAVRAEVPSPLTASVLDAGSGKAKIRITVPAGTSVGQRVLKVHSALAGVPPETVTWP
jgi:hypothetical protein